MDGYPLVHHETARLRDVDAGFGTKSFRLDHRLEAGGRLVAEASTVLVAYDYGRSESIELPETWKRRLAA